MAVPVLRYEMTLNRGQRVVRFVSWSDFAAKEFAKLSGARNCIKIDGNNNWLKTLIDWH